MSVPPNVWRGIGPQGRKETVGAGPPAGLPGRPEGQTEATSWSDGGGPVRVPFFLSLAASAGKSEVHEG